MTSEADDTRAIQAGFRPANQCELKADHMKFSEFVVREAIIPELKSTDRDGVLRELVSSLASAGALPLDAVDEVVGALVKREKNGSTGFGKGVAVPHVKHPRIKKMAGTIGRSAGG